VRLPNESFDQSSALDGGPRPQGRHHGPQVEDEIGVVNMAIDAAHAGHPRKLMRGGPGFAPAGRPRRPSPHEYRSGLDLD
jgi:hypothetical protein